jgi:CHAT domain-containing protein
VWIVVGVRAAQVALADASPIVAPPTPMPTLTQSACVDQWLPSIDDQRLRELYDAGARAAEEGNTHAALSAFQAGLISARSGADKSAADNSAPDTRAQDNQAISIFLSAIGIVQQSLGRYAEALQSYQAAFTLDQQLNGGSIWARDYWNMGVAETRLGRYADALGHSQSAVSLARIYHNCDTEAAARNALGSVQDDLGRYDEALQSFASALALHRQLSDRDGEAGDLASLGIAQEHLGRYAEAMSSETAAVSLELRHPASAANALGNIGNIQEKLGQQANALRSFDRALELFNQSGDRSGQAAALTDIALVYEKLGEHTKALEDSQAADALLRRLGSPRWQALAVVASAEGNLEQVAAAQRDYDAAFREIEMLRSTISDANARASFFAQALPVYDAYIAYLVTLDQRFPGRGYDARSFAVFERRQARVFLEQVAASAARSFSGIPDSLIDKERQLDAQGALHRSNTASFTASRSIYGGPPSNWEKSEQALLKDVERQQAALAAQIREKYPAYFELQHPRLLDARTLQHSVLHPNEAMVVYDVLPAVTALWVLTPSQPLRLFVLSGGAQGVQDKVASFLSAPHEVQNAIDNGLSSNAVKREAARDLPEFIRSSATLYGWLFPTAMRAMIARASTLFVVPTGALYRVPFEALVTNAGPPAKPQYLVEDHAVAYLSSASVLGVLRYGTKPYRQTAREPLAAFAPVTFGSETEATPTASADQQRTRGLVAYVRGGSPANGYPPLEGSVGEVTAVAAALHAPASDLFLYAHASLSTVNQLNVSKRLRDYRYVLFATHAVMPDRVQDIIQPSLVLAPSDAGGYLTMAGVFGLSLNADLVTLSACDSGGGVATKGEGVQGLTQAYMYAGTPVVSVTQWQIVDSVAQTFTPAFYLRLAKGESPAQALRETKLDMIRGSDPLSQHPFFWASMILFGDGSVRAGRVPPT